MKKYLSFLCVLCLIGCNGSQYYGYNVDVKKADSKISLIENDPIWIVKASDPTYRIAYPYDYSVLMYNDDYEFETEKNVSKKIVLAPFHYIYSSPRLMCYHGVQIFYKGKKIGKVESNSTGCSTEKTEHLKKVIPYIALCASRTGFSGTIGGEDYEEGKKSPSMVEFFKQCDLEY